MSGRLTWTNDRWSEVGRAGGIRLFSVTWGTTRSETPWHLSTDLPVTSKSIGQHYATEDDAKAAAERVLTAFLTRVQDQS